MAERRMPKVMSQPCRFCCIGIDPTDCHRLFRVLAVQMLGDSSRNLRDF